MVNYQLGKIYKIVCNTTGKIYIGSTCEASLARRLCCHRSDYKKQIAGKNIFLTSFEVMESDNYEIILVENYPCNSKYELHSRERFFIENNDCVNKVIPKRTMKEWGQDNKEHIKEIHRKYRVNHKEQINENHRKWCKDHMTERQIYNKIWSQENKQSRKESSKRWYDKNKDRLKAKREMQNPQSSVP